MGEGGVSIFEEGNVVKVPKFEERVRSLRKKRARLLELAKRHGTPLYVYDPGEAETNLKRFRKAFKDADVKISPFYALKSNPHLGLLKTIVKHGGYLDVSSVRELEIARQARPKRLIFTGPGKTREDFKEILKDSHRITVHLESLRELKLLSDMAVRAGTVVRCGIRVFTRAQAGWSKFGIPLKELAAFWQEAERHPGVRLTGVQFHISWNPDSSRYVRALRDIGRVLRREFSAKMLSRLSFLDIGGGFLTEGFEATYPWNPSQRIGFDYPKGFLEKLLNDKVRPRYVAHRIEPFERYAREIADAFGREILSVKPSVELWAEPGRFISHSVLHHVLRVVELKPERKAAILDGGNNMVGWEKQQWVDYTPIFNLTHMNVKREIPYLLYGSLCTANDIWGYYVYTGDLQQDDVLVMPFQGSYTYTLAQNFIKAIPPIVPLARG